MKRLAEFDLGVVPSINPTTCAAGPYITTASLVNKLAEAADERTHSRAVACYGRLDLLCLDELAYVHLDPRGAELLVQILTEREERASVAVARTPPSANRARRSRTRASRRPSSTA